MRSPGSGGRSTSLQRVSTQLWLTSRRVLTGDVALDRLPYAVEAPFNSYAKQHSPSCLPNTRVELLREIYSWADIQDERYIFWLNGLAGTGKSTIARTIARKYFEQERLGASFFFTRGDGDIGYAGMFVTSIAIQLASSIPTLRRYISDAVTKHSNIASQSLRDQWQLLVIGPLSKLDSNCYYASYILIVDALDECNDDNNIRIILQLLAEVRSLKAVRVRVFLTSRPEAPIRYSFYRVPKTQYHDFVLHNISPSIIDYDISIFLEHNFRLIGEEIQDLSWPGAQAIKTLVQSANGLFIWAATACRFIRKGPFADKRLHELLEGRAFADERLHILLKGRAFAATTPEGHLNGIYITVLQNSIQQDLSQQEREEFCSMLRDILGSIIALFSPLSVGSLSRLLVTPEQKLNAMLYDLHAILDIPKDYARPLRLHHPSFRDFLLNKNRCRDSDFQVEEKRAYQILADSCIKLMSISLKKDICGVRSPGWLATNIESSQLERCLPPEVQYACLYWAQHLQKSCTSLDDSCHAYAFLQEHLLHWLEALSLMGKILEGVLMLSSLGSYISVSRLI
jgi:NACHT domain